MKSNISKMLATAGLSLLVAGAASAADITVTGDIATSTTWTKNNVYKLNGQVYVLPGATLTIEAGTIISSNPAQQGSLAITRGARLVAIGTQSEPIIFTSDNDRATWTNGDSKTGTWRPVCNEWGNVTIMGSAYISEDATPGNTQGFNANNVAVMEGLQAQFPGDTRVLYGGGNDDDNSGTLSFVSFRYGGKVIGLNNELNGLSLGGIGRETVIDHMEIMNNIDDGIEIWGGTVNLQYVSVWNIGDDSLDIDQGWRGKLQFGLVVQGHSVTGQGSSGSGLGDNMVEIDGAENSFHQPVSTGVMYNITLIGNPGTTNSNGGDHAIAYRDNARLQFRQSIIMDTGENVVRNDNSDGDGGAGYGANGTHSWASTWTTNYNVFPTVNAPANPSLFYKSQVDGKLNEVKDTVFFNNVFATAYTEADARGVRGPKNSNVTAAVSPIVSLTRGAAIQPVTGLNYYVRPVIGIDPRAANDAVNSVGTAPNDGFYTPVNFRGAFSPTENWLCDWSAADAFGFTSPAANECPAESNCPADLNGDGSVGGSDLATLLASWGSAGGDVDGNGTTDGADLGALLASWGSCG
jgi:hypothetical protein